MFIQYKNNGTYKIISGIRLEKYFYYILELQYNIKVVFNHKCRG